MNINLIVTKVTAEQGGSRPSKLVKLRHNELEVERCENIVIVAVQGTCRAGSPDIQLFHKNNTASMMRCEPGMRENKNFTRISFLKWSR